MILAIDPGTLESAYVIYGGGKIHEAAIVNNGHMVGICRLRGVDVLAVEQICSYGMAVGAETFATCVASGRMIQSWISAGHAEESVLMIPRLDVKMFLCHTPRAKDKNIRQALIDRFGELPTAKRPNPNYPFRISSHEWAAVAVAVTAEDKLKKK